MNYIKFDDEMVAVTHKYFYENGRYSRISLENGNEEYWDDNEWHIRYPSEVVVQRAAA